MHAYQQDPSASLIQKCNLVLKTAGLSTRVKSYEQLELAAPVIFVRMFEALYHIKLHDVIVSSNNARSHAADLNSVLNLLREQRPSHLLLGITGEDIVRGSRHALEKVVEYYCEEVQIRLQEIERQQYELSNQAMPKFVAEHHRNLRKGEDRRRDIAEKLSDRLPHKHAPTELDILMERVDYLEKKMQSNRQPEAARKSPSKKKKKKSKPSGEDAEGRATELILSPAKPDEDAMQRPASAKTKARVHKQSDQIDSNSQPEQSSDVRPRSTRPNSAPLGGRRLRSSNRPQSSSNVRRCTSEEADAATPKKKKYTYLSSEYTYDLRSGRRIPIDQAKRIQHQLFLQNNPDAPPSPKKKDTHEEPTVTVPRWPGYSTQRSVAEWLEKSRQERERGKETTVRKLPPPHIYRAYSALENLDLVVTVEHCVKCARHSISLRHDEKEYVTKAENALRTVAHFIHSNRSCVRLGVTRFCAQIGDDGRATDVNSRIGALEIQVAYRNQYGELISDLIHSKLHSQCWPSKSVLEKRLRAFISQAGIQSHVEQDVTETEQDVASGGLSAYPVGIIDWAQTPIADPMWRYLPEEIQIGEPDEALQFQKSMQWIFDTRKLFTQQTFPLGTLVSITDYVRPSGEVEPLGLLGTLKQIYKDPRSMQDMALVQLKHTDAEVACEMRQCVEARKSQNTLLSNVPTSDAMPVSLFCLLSLAYQSGIADNWSIINESTDKIIDGSLFLCQASFFRTINDTVWEYVHHAGLDNATSIQMRDFSYTINLHLSYSEDVLNWVFRKFGRSINVMKLLDYVRDRPRQLINTTPDMEPTPEKPPASPVSPTEKARRVKEEEEEKDKTLVSNTIAHVAEIIRKESLGSTEEMGIVHSLRNGLRGVCLRLSEGSRDGVDDDGVEDDISLGLEKFFRAYDEKHTGEISLAAFRQTLEQFGLSYSDADLKCLWATLDRDGSKTINFNELLTFLNVSSANSRELGELWCIVWDTILAREGTGNDDDDKENSALLASLEEKLYAECSSSHHCICMGRRLVELLQAEGLLARLSEEDIALLVSSFCDNSSNISTLSDADNANVFFEDFFSWLQPVDIKLVAKRVIRFLKAIFQHERGLDVGVDSDRDMIKKLDPESTGRISKNDFRNCVSEFGLPVSCSEVRSIFLHFGSRGVMTYEEYSRLLSTKRDEIPQRQRIADTSHSDSNAHVEQIAYDDVIVALKSFNVRFNVFPSELRAGELTVGVTFQDFYQEATLEEKDSSGLCAALVTPVPFPVSGKACGAGEVIDIALRHDGIVCYTGSLTSAALNDEEEYEVPFDIELKSRLHGTCRANGIFILSDSDSGLEDTDVVVSHFDITYKTSAPFNSSSEKYAIRVKFQNYEYKERFEWHSVDNRQRVFVEWNRMHISREAIASRRKILVSVIGPPLSQEEEVFCGYISMKSLRALEKNTPHDIAVVCETSKLGNVSLVVSMTMREALTARSSRIQSMDGTALAHLKMKSLHSDGEDDASRSDTNEHADLFDLGSSFMASFNEQDPVPAEPEDAKPNDKEKDSGVIKEFSLIDQSLFNNSVVAKQDLRSIPELVVRFSKLHAKQLKSIEMFGNNDPFVNLSFGDWSQRTTTRQDAGAEAEWVYEMHDHNMLFEASGRELDEIPLHIEVFDENSLVKSKLIGSGDVFVRQSGKLRVELRDDNSKHSGIVEIDVAIDTPEPHLVSGVLKLNKMGFMLKTKKKSPKNVRVSMTLGYWHHALEGPVVNNTVNWLEPDVATDIEGAVLRKRKFHLDVFFDDVLAGKAKCSLRGLLSSNSQNVAVDVTDDAYHKIGRIFLNADFSQGMDHDTLAVQDERQTQKQLLLQIFEETGGQAHWKDTLLWNAETDVSTWGELEVNSDNLVTELRLNYNNLFGSIPPCIGQLNTLQSLEMFGNSLQGEIPSALGSLTSLKRLYLNNNSLTGSLPVSLSNLKNLEELDVSENQLSGFVPRELALPTLTVLVLSENNFVGPLPIEFTELYLLATFACDFVPYVDDRKMSSAWIEYQYYLDVESKESQRPIDTTSENALVSLKDIFGEMSESSSFFDGWGTNGGEATGVTFDQFNSVSSLILRGMSLYGNFPAEINLLKELVFLDLSKNNIQGCLPDELKNLSSLRYLYLRENYLDGDVMTVVCAMTSLRAVDLSENQITGSLPESLGDMCYLEKLYLRENQLSG